MREKPDMSLNSLHVLSFEINARVQFESFFNLENAKMHSA